MTCENTSSAVLTPASGPEGPPAASQSFFAHTAALEFQATLQLLAERAKFLTAAMGAAIALKTEKQFVYSAIAGEFAAEPATPADLNKKNLSECVRLGTAVRMRTESRFALAVPVLRGVEVAGFFELTGTSAFEEHDAESIARLAQMAATAVDHRDAAARAEKLDFEEGSQATSDPARSRWHAPQTQTVPAPEDHTVSPVEVQKCSSCGFPVSAGRKLCVDCDKNADVVPEPAELFTTPAEESWLSAYGYTIASVLVSAIAIAFIMWLRAR